MPNINTETLTADSIIVASEDQISSKLDDEKVILSLEDGMYYGLNPAGARVWDIIQKPTSIKDVQHQLLNVYDVDAEQCERDLLALISDLAAEDLIEIS